MRILAGFLALFALAGVGCSGGSQGEVATAVGVNSSPWLVVDLSTRSLSTFRELPDLLSNQAYRSTHVVFRRIDGGATLSGSVSLADFGAQGDEVPQRAGTVGTLFVAVFELTQDQWLAMGGTALWREAGALRAGGGIDAGNAPAYNLDRDSVTQIFTSASAGTSYRLALPTSVQWEYACRAGVTAEPFSWGASVDLTGTVHDHAVVAQTHGDATGPQPAGVNADASARLPNAFGIYDTHGNVWEWASDGDGVIRGGSWNDSLTMARCANQVALDHTTKHPLVGVRPILVP